MQKVERLVAGCDLEEMQKIMASLFGEVPAMEAVRAFNERIGNEIVSGRSQYDPQKGSLFIPASAAVIAAPSVPRSTPRHTFYGAEQRER